MGTIIGMELGAAGWLTEASGALAAVLVIAGLKLILT